MAYIELTAPCNFGIEAILKREIEALGYEISKVDDGRVSFLADEFGICKANINLRTAERILIKMAEFEALSFEELFQNTKKVEWEKYIPKNGKFPVAKASSIKSKLFSTSDIQSIVKKAVVERLKNNFKLDWFSEEGAKYPIHVFVNKDIVTLYLDTSGVALHKRGYREHGSEASIKETLAAALVLLTPWKRDRVLIDPLCGSGTILIEAALIGKNIAPGINREFEAENWDRVPKKLWDKARNQAKQAEITERCEAISGFDIDENVLKIARENAKLAGVGDDIHFQKRDMRELSSKDKYGFIITNPPYGKRLQDQKSVEILYKDMGATFSKLPSWSFYIITAFENFEKAYGKRADKKRKLYNGMLKTDYYQFYGPKPPKRNMEKIE